MRRIAAAVLAAGLALALVLGLGGCRTAKQACRHHGGVARVTVIGTNHYAFCNDGSEHGGVTG